jgi:hypothetical protein
MAELYYYVRLRHRKGSIIRSNKINTTLSVNGTYSLVLLLSVRRHHIHPQGTYAAPPPEVWVGVEGVSRDAHESIDRMSMVSVDRTSLCPWSIRTTDRETPHRL